MKYLKRVRKVSVLPQRIALAVVVLGVTLFYGGSQSMAYVTRANLDAGIKIPVYQSGPAGDSNGGPALNNAGAIKLLAKTGSPVVSYGTYDCFSGDPQCGDPEAGQRHYQQVGVRNPNQDYRTKIQQANTYSATTSGKLLW